ncbi:signal-induced proliferation-associated 1-like protein 2 [Protopterus annectens]|uniref:signal-induced proliferation-associated 1-like protein 2 n=1 Tax=Protopterus annectens TaxID=7888 RepID=UPI001CFA1F1C|nr:signal-induced proliferation-associated 1-like protein 2 [Protopterus annectens]
MSDQSASQEDQHMFHRGPSRFKDSMRNMQSDDYFARKFKALNSNASFSMALGTPTKSESQPNGTPAMPKMGVRARVSEWPPKKDCLKELPSKTSWEGRSPTGYEGAGSAVQNGQNEQNIENSIEANEEVPVDMDFTKAKYSIGDIFSQSPQRGLHPIRQRSNSDVTISDIDSDDILDQNAVNPNTGAALHREYGSTSSIDRQGLSGENFFAMLRGYRVENIEQRNFTPFVFSEVFQYDPVVSPSLHAAAKISRGEFVRLSGFDYLDSSLLLSRDKDKSFKHRLKSESVETSIFRKLRTAKSEHEALKFSLEQDDSRLDKSLQPLSYQKCFAHYDVQSILFNISEAMANRTNVGKRINTTTGASAASQHQISGGQPGSCESPLGSKEDLNSKDNLETDEGDGKSNDMVLSCPYFRNEVGGEGDSCNCCKFSFFFLHFFFNTEHQNYFGTDDNLGPVAVSIRREKLDDAKDKDGSQYNYRITFRTSELTTLRGAILEDAIPSTARHGTARGLPLKEVLEYTIPELSIQCLRLAANSPKVPEQLLKLDEQGVSKEVSNFSETEEKAAALPDSTGTHSLYTTYKDYELMFHVSTMLPYTPNNRQQLLRKRHIGNDIVTIVFQEPGAIPFTSKHIRSHFQHVFVIVRVHNPCTENVCYSVVVSRSKDVPPFGPPIPKGVTFPKSAVFRDFLLAKVINAENAAHKSEKFRAMATRTRQEYLKDLAENFVTTSTIDTSVKFSFITLGAKKKEKLKARQDAHLYNTGAIVWNVVTRDFGQSSDIECLLGISNEFIVLIEKDSKNVVFNCSCRDVIGWTSELMNIKIFYERGECVILSSVDSSDEDVREIVQRLEIVTRGCETTEMTLRRNGLGQLGFHVNFEGIVADVEPFGFAWKSGLRQGSRLVEICKVAVATLTHEQMIDLLRTSLTVKVVIIQPHEDGSPRRGCSELYRIPMVEYKLDSEGTPCEYKTPFRRNTTWHRVQTPVGQPVSRGSPIQGAADRLPCQQLLQQSQTAIPRSTSFDRKLPDGARQIQDVETQQIPQCTVGESSQHYRSSPSNQSSSSDPGPSGSNPWRPQAGFDGSQSPIHQEPPSSSLMEGDGPREHDEGLERIRPSAETKWHTQATKISSSYKDRSLQKDSPGKDSPNRLTHIADKNCSSHSSSNTLSSSASSNSDDKRFGLGDFMDSEVLGLTYIKGASTDSGIDTASCVPAPVIGQVHLSSSTLIEHNRTDEMVTWADTDSCKSDEEQTKLYSVHKFSSGISASHTSEGSMGDLSEMSSHSRALYDDLGDLSTSDHLQASLRNAVNKQQHGLFKEDFLKLMLPDSPPAEEGRRKFSISEYLSPRRSLYRTLSDESMCSNRRGSSHASSRSSILDQALPNDILFSTTPPYHSTLPPRVSLNQCSATLRTELWFSDGSLADKSKFNDPGLMPLPDTASGLDWSNLVDAARAFEGLDSDEDIGPVCHHTRCLDQRVASFCTLNDMQQAPDLECVEQLSLHGEEKDFIDAVRESSPTTLTGKVNQLEMVLRQLQNDLRKEKEDKVLLQAEVQHLRRDNMRLQEESLIAAAQLKKFTEWFFSTIDKKP